MLRRNPISYCLLLATILTACDDRQDAITSPGTEPSSALDAAPLFHKGGGEPFSVLTRNVYLGGDTGPVFQADFKDLGAILLASATVWAGVQSTNFAERAVALVDEIAEGRPHFIGLQEVARFIIPDGQGSPIGLLDFLDILETEIAARGLSYTVVAVQENTNVTLPVAFDPDVGVTQLVNFTDRDVVLARSDVSIEAVANDNYATTYTLAPGVTLKRGWIRVSTKLRGVTYNFVNTHLESQALAPIQAGQLQELLGSVLAGLHGVTVLVGDLNSDAEAEQGDASWTPSYDELIAHGFVDTWDESHSDSEPGFTCCNDPDLLNLAPSFDQRIDFVLVRGRGATIERVIADVDTEVLGDEIDDRTEGGLWPSDHGGLLARFELDNKRIRPSRRGRKSENSRRSRRGTRSGRGRR